MHRGEMGTICKEFPAARTSGTTFLDHKVCQDDQNQPSGFIFPFLCRPCACDAAGSIGTCDPHAGHCSCKEKVEGFLCNRCQPGAFNLQPHNPAGCTSCFCFGHSQACAAAPGYEVHNIISDFRQGQIKTRRMGLDGWRAETPVGQEVPLSWEEGEIFLQPDKQEAADFVAPEKFLCDQRLSYGQELLVRFHTQDHAPNASPFPIWLVLKGDGFVVSVQNSSLEGHRNITHHEEHAVTFRLHEIEEKMQPTLSPFQFQRLLSNLTEFRIQVESRGRPGMGSQLLQEARWLLAPFTRWGLDGGSSKEKVPLLNAGRSIWVGRNTLLEQGTCIQMAHGTTIPDFL
uniref:Uncharacterized protein n=1 Tax=Sphaerodactylus townsendi TaxID=933632 RepID=A0ACB8F0J2_9SAUR